MLAALRLANLDGRAPWMRERFLPRPPVLGRAVPVRALDDDYADFDFPGTHPTVTLACPGSRSAYPQPPLFAPPTQLTPRKAGKQPPD